MALTRAFVQNAAMTALDARFFSAGTLQKNSDNSVRLGQLWGNANAVASTASMSVAIADGSYWVVSRGVSDGALVLANNGQATVTLPTAPASNSRYDTVWVKHNDSTFGDADSNPVFGVTSGTAAASPSIPTPPTGAFRLANILVPAGVTATNASGVTITNVYQFTALSGSPIRYRTVAELLADSPNAIDGALGYIKGGGLYFLRGGVWSRTDANTFGLVTGTGSLVTGTTNVTFPATSTGTFTSDSTILPVLGNAGFTAVYAGYYEVSAAVNWGGNTTGERFLELTTNLGSVSPVRVTDRRATGGTTGASADATLSGTIYCNAGDQIFLRGWQNSGATLAYAMRLSARLMAFA